MKKIIHFLIILFSIVLLSSQDLDKKQQQLEELKENISKQEELIKKAEKNIKKINSNLQEKAKKRKEIENKIKELKKKENEVKNELENIKKNLSNSNSRLQFIDQLRQKELKKLCIAHYEKMIFPQKEIDAIFLANLINNTTYEMNEEKERKNLFANKEKGESKNLENIKWSHYVTNKKDKTVKKNINELSNDLEKNKKNKQQASIRKGKMEKEAAALDELITKLQMNLVEKDYSYKFSTEKLIWPVKGEIIKKFGVQKSGSYNVSLLNNGIDIQVSEGTEVVAVDDGVVAFAEWFTGAGKLVIIDHKNGFFTLYSHNSTLLVTKGDNIKKNQKIALTGKTGSTDEACLHFELRKRGIPVDPLQYLE